MSMAYEFHILQGALIRTARHTNTVYHIEQHGTPT